MVALTGESGGALAPARRRRDPRAVDRDGPHPGVPPGDRAAPRAPRRARPLPAPELDAHRASTSEHLFGSGRRLRSAPPTEASRCWPNRSRPRSSSACRSSEVTFCVVDLETTGGSPVADAITEIGAVKYRGGERLGVVPVAREPAPPDPAVDRPPHRHRRPSGLGGAAASSRCCRRSSSSSAARCSWRTTPGSTSASSTRAATRSTTRRCRGRRCAPPGSRAGSCGPTCPTCGSRTLANYFRTRAKPTHRALDDAEACAEVLHGLLDLGGRLGIVTLGDLTEAVRARGRPNFGKIRARRRAAARARRLPVPRPRRAGALRGQGQRSAGACEVLLLR